MIKLENVTFKYAEPILDDINLTIEKNKITFIIGANGSGKSTLANIISGLSFPKSGKVYLDDIRLTKRTKNKLVRKKIGMVFQNPNNQILFPRVYEDIEFTLENMKYPKKEIPALIQASLAKVNMTNYIDANPYQLSGGQKQKIAIASQLSYSPEYLIFDEATSMIDINGKNDIYNLLKTLKKDMGVIYITNDLSELIYADRVIIINNRKVSQYSLTDILKDNNILSKHQLDVPFILKLASSLGVKDIDQVSEAFILGSINHAN